LHLPDEGRSGLPARRRGSAAPSSLATVHWP
jgi:hypothetical protein